MPITFRRERRVIEADSAGTRLASAPRCQPNADVPVTPSRVRHTPLIEAHRKLGAKLVEFGGWEMPLSYSAGTLTEHRSCRTSAVAFDVSHLGTVRVEGHGSFDRLQSVLSNDLRRVSTGRAQYTHLLDEVDGSVVDDLIVWWVDDEVFDVMPNASNTERVVAALGGEDTTDSRAVIAVQGPHARSMLRTMAPAAASVARFGVARFSWEGADCLVAGTGYTGEDGVECAMPSAVAESFWTALLDSGVAPAGLGARDTLRLEAGLPLHGHELGQGITPLQAGLGWVVGWDKSSFQGRSALVAEQESGPLRRLIGLTTEGRQPPREDTAVLLDGRRVGTVTSGNYSPMLGHGVALALVHAKSAGLSGTWAIEQRNRTLPATLARVPFVHRGQWAEPA